MDRKSDGFLAPAPRQTVSARVWSVQHGGQMNGFHSDTSALNAVGPQVHGVPAVNIAATSPVYVSRRAGSHSPRLRAQLYLLRLLLLTLLFCAAPFSHCSQPLCGGVPVSAVGPAGVDLRPKETRANSPALLRHAQGDKDWKHSETQTRDWPAQRLPLEATPRTAKV